MIKKNIYNLLLVTVAIILIFIYFFHGHFYYSSEGYIILKQTPYTILKAIEESDGIYYYHTIVNGNNILIELPPDFLDNTPVKLHSYKLGDLQVNIFNDLKEDHKSLTQSQDIDVIKKSNYSINQINIIYKYFDYHFDDNRILTIPNYLVAKKTNIMIAGIILVLLHIVAVKITKYEKYNKIIIFIIFIIGLLVSLFISGRLIITKI